MADKSPDAFRTISEVADWLGVQPHVLRFWESKFSQVRPVKRAGGRRYYRPNDMLLLGGIRKLLHEDGLTIKGAQKVLREEGLSHVARLSQPLDAESAALSEMMGSFEEPAADDPAESQREEADTGQLLDFGAARTSPPDRTQPAPAQAVEPAAKAAEDPPPPGPEPSVPPSAPAETPDSHGPPPGEATESGKPIVADDLSAPEHSSEEETAPQESALPSFRHSSGSRQPSAPDPSAPPDRNAQPASDRLPSFLKPPDAQPGLFDSASDDDVPPEAMASKAHSDNSDPPTDDLNPPQDAPRDMASEDAAADSGAEIEEPPAPAAPRPKVVDAPDPDDSMFAISAGALSASYSATSLSKRKRARILPLVAQLAALRDRMAAGRDR